MLLNVKLGEDIAFTEAYNNLMKDFSIPDKYHNIFLDSLRSFQYHLAERGALIIDISNAINALKFFKSYMVYTENITQDSQKKTNRKIDPLFDPVKQKLVLQLQDPISKQVEQLNYYGTAQIAVEFLYELMRKNDVYLQEVLFDSPQIPSSKELKSMISKLNIKIGLNYLSAIQKLINNLSLFIGKNIPNELSRCKNCFIFELLYIADLIQYIKKANNLYGKDYALDNITPTEKFLRNKKLSNSQKTGFITKVIYK